MQISAGVVLAGDLEAAEPLAGTPHYPPQRQAGRCLATPQARGAGPARMGLAGALELGFDFACVPISVAAVQSRCGALAATRQFIPEREAGGERRGRRGWGLQSPLAPCRAHP